MAATHSDFVRGTSDTAIRIRFMRGLEVDDARGRCKAQRYLDISAGRLPPPVKIGRWSFWPEHEVMQVLAAELRGASDDELRELVCALLARRASFAKVA